jgi:putative flippase GtrA
MTQALAIGFMRKQSVQQFMKFCIIGATSTIIDVGIFNALCFSQHLNPITARVISVSIAVCNGFLWNSVWTFRGMGSGRRHHQFVKFAAVNLVGLVLNLAIMQAVMYLLTGHFMQQNHPDKLHTNMGLAVAIVIVSCWNFIANKRWTFGGKQAELTN